MPSEPRRWKISVSRPACTCRPGSLVRVCGRHGPLKQAAILVAEDRRGEFPPRPFPIHELSHAFDLIGAADAQ